MAGDGDRYILLASVLAIMVGVWAIIGGLARLGFITRFISRPILLGYIVGSAWLIVISQLPAMLGIGVDEDGDYSALGAILQNLDQANAWTVILGIVAIFNLQDFGVTLIGSIESGIPFPKIPFVPIPDVVSLILPAAGLTLLAYADSVVTAESLARADGYEIDANQEFIGLGAASIASGLFQGFPVNGSQTRSVVLDDSGAKTQMSGLISALLVIVTLLMLTPVFELLPNVTLAAIVMVAGIGLFDIKEMKTLWRLQRADFILMVLTALGVIVIGMLPGILIAVVLSLLDVARRSTTPHTAVLVQVPGTDTFRDADSVGDGEAIPGLLIYRFDAPLFFANVSVMEDQLTSLVKEADPPIEWVLIDAESIPDMDTTALQGLGELLEDLSDAGITVVFARLRQAVRDLLDAAGLIDVIGEDNIYLEVDDGVAAFNLRTDRQRLSLDTRSTRARLPARVAFELV